MITLTGMQDQPINVNEKFILSFNAGCGEGYGAVLRMPDGYIEVRETLDEVKALIQGVDVRAFHMHSPPPERTIQRALRTIADAMDRGELHVKGSKEWFSYSANVRGDIIGFKADMRFVERGEKALPMDTMLKIREPIDMVLHCPNCSVQHIDAPEELLQHEMMTAPEFAPWNNPPHRSHLCHSCGHIWRPADVPTNGVAAVKTKGKDDSPISTKFLDTDTGSHAR